MSLRAGNRGKNLSWYSSGANANLVSVEGGLAPEGFTERGPNAVWFTPGESGRAVRNHCCREIKRSIDSPHLLADYGDLSLWERRRMNDSLHAVNNLVWGRLIQSLETPSDMFMLGQLCCISKRNGTWHPMCHLWDYRGRSDVVRQCPPSRTQSGGGSGHYDVKFSYFFLLAVLSVFPLVSTKPSRSPTRLDNTL